MRPVTPHVLVAAVVVAGLAASAAFASGLATGAGEAGKPRVIVASTVPLVVVGQRFKAGERIAVSASIGSAEARKTARADDRGRFRVRFRTATPCAPIVVVASGHKGSRAAAKKHVTPAPCGVDPAPAP